MQLQINDSTTDITCCSEGIYYIWIISVKEISEVTEVTTFRASVVPTTSASERSPEPRSRSRPLTPTSDEALLGVPEPPPHLSRRNLWKVLAYQYLCRTLPLLFPLPTFLISAHLPSTPATFVWHGTGGEEAEHSDNVPSILLGYGTGALSAIQPGEITYWV